MNTQEAIKILERDAPNYADFSIVRDYDDAVLKYRQALTHAIEVMKRLSLPKIDGLEKAIKEDFELRQDCLGQVYWPYSLVLESALEYLKHSEGGAE